jgi:hypothetical protein
LDEDEDEDEDDDDDDVAAAPLPRPPAGFVLDPDGKVLMVSNKRLVPIVDPMNNWPLECVIRRVFKSSQGHDCMVLCPVDMPVLILRSANFSGWTSISDEEINAVIPSAEYALAKIHMHLVNSGFCLTARGGFAYGEDDIFDFNTDGGDALDGMSSEGVEVTCFNHDGAHYMIYTPCDPVLFVAVKDNDGVLKIADDDLLDDPAVVGAVNEETEFNAMVVCYLLLVFFYYFTFDSFTSMDLDYLYLCICMFSRMIQANLVQIMIVLLYLTASEFQ